MQEQNSKMKQEIDLMKKEKTQYISEIQNARAKVKESEALRAQKVNEVEARMSKRVLDCESTIKELQAEIVQLKKQLSHSNRANTERGEGREKEPVSDSKELMREIIRLKK